MDIIRGGRRPGTASRSLRPSSGARRSWARDSVGVSDAAGRLRQRPQTAPSRSQLIRPGSADSKHLRELYKGVNVGRGSRPVTSGGKVDAHMLVAALDSVEHTEAQLKAMRRIMQLCDPKPSAKLASANCRALAAAGGIPVLVRLLTCGATQLEWGAVLSLGSIAAFDNSTNAGSKHEIRQHGGLGDFVAMLWHHSLGVQKLAACAIANMAHNAWPEYGTLQQEIAQEVRIARANGFGGFERLLQLLEGKPDEVTEWAAAAICNLSLCDEDSREHIFFADGVTTLVRCLETVAPDQDAVELVRAAPAYQDQRLVPTEQEQKVSELVASTLCNLAADNEQRAGTICDKGGVSALVRLLFSTAPALVEGALHSLQNIASTSPEHAARIVGERAVERVVFCLLTDASQSAHAAAASLLHVLAASSGDIWDGGDAPAEWENDPSADAGGNGDGGPKSEYRWLPNTSGAVSSGSQAIARSGGVPALIKHLYTPQAGPAAAATLQAMGIDVRSARIVLEGLAGDLDRAVEVYERRLSAQQEAFERLMVLALVSVLWILFAILNFYCAIILTCSLLLCFYVALRCCLCISKEENKRLKSQVDQAVAKERERASREFWGDNDEGDEGILPLEDGDVVKIMRPGSPSGSGRAGSVAGGEADSRPSSASGSRPGSASILRRPGSGAASRPGSAPADDKRSRQVTYWRDKKVEEEQAKDAPAEKPGSVEAERVAAKRLERIAKEKEERDPQMMQLNELIRLAQQHNLPGVDPNSISVRTSTRQHNTSIHSIIVAAVLVDGPSSKENAWLCDRR
jgi:hypothetical protein